MSLVLDASVAVIWTIAGQSSPASNKLLQTVHLEGAIVPAMWLFEVASVLLRAVRQSALSEEALARFVRDLLTFDIDVERRNASIGELIEVASRYSLTGYDAAYLELAMRTGLPLATFDRELAQAAERAGVRVATGG